MRWLTKNPPARATLDLHPSIRGASLPLETGCEQGATTSATTRTPPVAHSTRWSGRRAAFLGDRRRSSPRHRAPDETIPTHTVALVHGHIGGALGPLVGRLGAVAAWMATVLLVLGVPVTTWADGAPPEVLVAIDASESMQYAIGHSVAPNCGDSSPVRSRWNAVLEMLLGTNDGYGCTVSPLADHPDGASPPKQLFGAKQCIAGVPGTIAESITVPPDTSDSQPVSDRSLMGQSPSPGIELRLETTDSDMRLPYLVVDTKNVPITDDWVGGTVTLTTRDGTGTLPIDRWVVLVAAPAPPSTMSSKDWVCKTNDDKRVLASQPAKIAAAIGGKTVLTLTSDFVKTLRKARDAGKTQVTFAIAPAGTWLAPDCATRMGDSGNKYATIFHGPLAWAENRPVVSIAVGKVCQREGPGFHYAATGTRLSDGLIASFNAVAKFSLLLPDNVLNKAADGNGAYSFGAAISSLWGDVNVGLADPFASGSPSIPVARGDTMGERALVNSKISSSLVNVQPNGGAPIGRLLEDIVAMVSIGPYQDPHTKSLAEDPVNGDPYAECRQRYVLLFTDGGSNLDDGVNDARQDAIAAAGSLRTLGITLYVVSVADDGSNASDGPSKADRDFLDQLATAGGSGSAWRLQNSTELVKRLKNILGVAQNVGEVRTRTIWTEATGTNQDVQHTFHARSYFNAAEPVLSKGALEQRLLSCQKQCVSQADPSTARVCAVVDYVDRIATRTEPRTFYSTVSGQRIEFSVSGAGPDAMQIPSFGTAPKLRPDTSGSCVSQANAYFLNDNAQREAYRKDLIALLRSESGSCREEIPFGAPSDAQMAVLEPASKLPLSDPVFKSYASTATPSSSGFTEANPTGSFRRPTMLFTATHDGFLHAFRTDRDDKVNVTDQAVSGDELWAWLPGFALRRVRDFKLIESAAGSLLGGDLVATHALLERQVAKVSEAALQWRAVVLGGAGEAGAGYFALDVTSPMEPRLLWEITPDQQCWGPDTKLGGVDGPKCKLSNKFQSMGRSTARPVLARAFYKVQGSTVERTVAILAAGRPPSSTSVTNTGVDGNGKRSIFIVELASGQLVRELDASDIVTTGVTTAINSKNDLGHFWTEPACYNVAPGALVSRCFVGDSKGMIWRIDLSNENPAQWKIEFFHDSYSGPDTPAAWVRDIHSADRVPVRSPPSMALNRAGELVLVYGTGSADESSSATRRHLVYSVTETFALGGSGNATVAKPRLNWVYTNTSSTQFIGPALVFSGNAYWSTYTLSAAGLCSVGTGELWGADFESPKTPSDPTMLFGAFPNPAAPAKPSANLDHVVVGTFQPSPVEVSPIPACFGGCAPGDYNCMILGGGALGGKPPAYQVTVGTTSPSQASGQAPPTGTQPAIGTSAQQLSPPRSTAVITGWDLLYD